MKSLRAWCDRAWATLTDLPGGVGSDARARWDEHAARPNVVVTLFGPYDSGKSSLLKRLLVDDNRAVPDWLTVSGRRETFELKEASLFDVVVRDTPGIAGGNEMHEQVAKAALLLTDVVVVVLPPQLVTSDREALFAVLTGSRFRCPTSVAYPVGGIVVVLSRMDEAGGMPRDDLEGYQRLIQRKRAEFSELLRAQQLDEGLLAVYAVAADPFGLVGNGVATAKDYDGDRAWDGVMPLASSFRQLSQRKGELRVHAETRFLASELGDIGAALGSMALETGNATNAASNEAMAHALVGERLAALLGAARASLDRRIEEEVSAAGRRGAADATQLRGEVLKRLDAALDRWAEEQDAALESLIREADVEMNTRRDRPSWKNLSEVLGRNEATVAEARSDTRPQDAIEKAKRLTKALGKGVRESLPVTVGMSLEKARTELQRLKKASSFEAYAKETTRTATRFRDAAHATQAQRAVLLSAGFEVAVPALLELGGLVAEVWVDHHAAQKRAERREEVRRVINEASTKLAERAWKLWRDEGTPARLEAAVAEARARAESTAAALVAEGEVISAAVASVASTLEELTRMPSRTNR